MYFYIDESGNTGGASKTSLKSSFGGQRIFTLAAIGAHDEDFLLKRISHLLARHNIKSAELKASTLYKKKPQFIYDVLSVIKSVNAPVFIEAVDKRFMLTANIVNSLVFPDRCFESETRESNFIRNTFAEYLFFTVPDALYNEFLNLCDQPSKEGVNQMIDNLTAELGENLNEVSAALIQSLSMTKGDVEESNDISKFIPIPDTGKHGKLVWMLPNLSSFTNLYARINLYMKGDLSNVQIFHDEQLQFDSIIKAAKIDVEGFPSEKFGFISDSSDYNFSNSANLFFKDSHGLFGIQIADLIAGFVMRFISQRLQNESIDKVVYDAHRMLMTMNREEIGVGMNMVMSAQDANLINRCATTSSP